MFQVVKRLKKDCDKKDCNKEHDNKEDCDNWKKIVIIENDCD